MAATTRGDVGLAVVLTVEETRSPNWFKLVGDDGVTVQFPAGMLPAGWRKGTRVTLRADKTTTKGR